VTERWLRPVAAVVAGAGMSLIGVASLHRFTWGRFGAFAGVAVVVAAAAYVPASRRDVSPRVRQALLGAIIGANAAINAVLAWRVALAFAPSWLAIGVAGVWGAAVLVGAVPTVARDDRYQAVLGPANLVLPASWPVQAGGLAMLVISLAGAALGRKRPAWTLRLQVDRGTSTLFVKGGVIGNHIPRGSTGFDMGNVAFTQGNAPDLEYLLHHETGHTLSLAALGSLFHGLGAVDENVVRRGTAAFAEMVAESHVPVGQDRGHPIVSLWGRS
jgi:hypothetical protein